jgi:hypothetical protein
MMTLRYAILDACLLGRALHAVGIEGLRDLPCEALDNPTREAAHRIATEFEKLTSDPRLDGQKLMRVWEVISGLRLAS